MENRAAYAAPESSYEPVYGTVYYEDIVNTESEDCLDEEFYEEEGEEIIDDFIADLELPGVDEIAES